MKWFNCPTCLGDCFGVDGDIFFPTTSGPDPCPTCTDSDGNPTGRVGVMSDGEVGAVDDLLQITADLSSEGEEAWTELERGLSEAFKAELSHRKG